MALLHLTKENFTQEVMQSDKPVLIDFWASWCGPCRMVGPIIEELANEVKDAKIGKVNVDEEEELANKFGIRNIPTIIVVKGRKEIKRVVGVRSKDELKALLKV